MNDYSVVNLSLLCPRIGHRRCRVHRGHRLANDARRSFTASSRSQIIIVDEEEDEGQVTPTPRRASRRPSAARIAPQNMNDLIRARELRAQQRLNKPLDPKKLREIERKARVMENISVMVHEYLETKYALVEHRLSHSATAIKTLGLEYDQYISMTVLHLERWAEITQEACLFLEHQYCKIVFHRLPYLRSEVSKSARILAELHVKVIRSSLAVLKQDSKLLRIYLHQEYLSPRNVARAKVDRALKRTNLLAQQYIELQGKVSDVLSALNSMTPLLQALASLETPSKLRYENFLKKILAHGNDFGTTAHVYRWFWRTTRRSEIRLGDAYLLEFFTLVNSVRSAAIAPSRYISSIMFEGKESQRTREIMHRQRLRVIDRIRRAYLQRWKGPKPTWSPALNKYWRQLDLFAPFEIQRLHHMLLTKEVLYLIPTTAGYFGPMWEGLAEYQTKELRNYLVDWHKSYRASSKEYLVELELYRYISWYRFGLEERMAKTRVPNIIQAEGLFVSDKPISQELGRFYRWIHQMMELRDRGFAPDMAVRMSKESNFLQTWSRMTDRFKEEAAARKSQILDLGSVKVRRRGVSRKTAKIPRLTRFKSVRQKVNHAVRSRTVSESQSGNPADTTAKEASQTQVKRTSASRQRRRKKRQSLATASKPSGAPRRNTDQREKPRLSVAAVDSPSQVGKTSRTSLLSNAEARTPQSTNGEKGRDRASKRASDKLQSSRSGQPVSKLSSSSGSKANDKYDTVDQGPVRRNDKRSTDKKTSRVGNPWTSVQRNFWEPNPITIPGGLNPRPKDRPYSTASRMYGDFNADELRGQNACIPQLQASNVHSDKISILSENTDRAEEGTISAEEETLFWKHSDQLSPDGQKPKVHYCKSRESTERVLQHFLDSKVIGFDLEWQAQASASSGVQKNVSLIQIADEKRIALFQIALFKPSRTREDLVAPTLKHILESPDITKVGVSIKADSTRLRRYLGIETRSILELSHLYKLIRYGQTQPALVNKRLVNLSDQVQAHLGLPLEKSGDVRCSNWTIPLNYSQVSCEYRC